MVALAARISQLISTEEHAAADWLDAYAAGDRQTCAYLSAQIEHAEAERRRLERKLRR